MNPPSFEKFHKKILLFSAVIAIMVSKWDCPGGGNLKFLALLMWVGQFGFSAIFPTVFFLILAEFLRNKFGLGLWIVAVLGIIGILTSIRACLHSMQKAAQELTNHSEPPVGFNDHS